MDPFTKCLLCQEDFSNTAPVTVRNGLESLKMFARLRGDALILQELGNRAEVQVHAQCRKKYTDSRLIAKLNRPAPASPPKRVLRSAETHFCIQTDCLLCGETLPTEDYLRRNPSRYEISHIRTSDIDKTLRSVISFRRDAWAEQVQRRIDSVLGLFAADARYHRQCHKNFIHPNCLPIPNTASLRGRTVDDAKAESFEKLCHYLTLNDECQYSLDDLDRKLQEIAPLHERYNGKYLIQKLQERFGDAVVISSAEGRKTVVCFRGATARLLYEKWYTERSADPAAERMRIIETSAALVRQDIRGQVYDLNNYPSVEAMRCGGQEFSPESLKQLVNGLIRRERGGVNDRHSTFIQQCILSAARPRSYISPLKCGLAVLLHRKYGSRYLLKLLSQLGACSEYQEAVTYEERAATASASAPPQARTSTSYHQYVFDNADFNTRTLDGHGTFHTLGGIHCITPEDDDEVNLSAVTLPKQPPTGTVDVRSAGRMQVTPFTPEGIRGLQNVLVQSVAAPTDQSFSMVAALLQAVWAASHFFQFEMCSGWNGFMSALYQTKKQFSRSSVLPLPFIHLEATNMSAIYSSLLFAPEESKRLGQRHCLVTFDLPLYVKAMDIVKATPCNPLLRCVIIRLGGFHLLMSFLGSIGFFMSCSGLEELWQTVYAKNSIRHMMSGHAYSRAVRAHTLTLLALALIVLENKRVPEHLNDALQTFINNTKDGKTLPEEVLKIPEALKFQEILEAALNASAATGRTASLWVQYFKWVELVLLFVFAERSANWQLHLECVRKMLPLFHASGHLNYAKAAHLYFQEMQSLENTMSPEEFQKFTEQGFFTIRRTEKFWSGTWSDMVIEQVLMRRMKTQGGLTQGRGFTDSVLARWVHALPVTTRVIEAIEDFCGVSSETSEQHKELRDSRIRKDKQDLQKFVVWLKVHSPFDKPADQIVSLSSGMIGDSATNCDEAEKVGLACMGKACGKTFAELHLHRKDTAKTLALVTHGVRVRDEVIEINPNQLFHRIVCVTQTEDDLKECFKFELAPWAPSLFENGFMRKGNKAALISKFQELSTVSESSPAILPENIKYCIDGGFLLHKLVWPRPAVFSDIFDAYLKFVQKHYGTNALVVFDGDSIPSLKDEEHLRRYAKAGCAEIEVDEATEVVVQSQKFFSNSANKMKFIRRLSIFFQDHGLETLQAADDADRLIVTTALEIARDNGCSGIVGEDTDLLVLMLAISEQQDNIYMVIPGKDTRATTVFSCQELKQKLGVLQEHLLFLHAVSGCDSTSALYGKGKKTAWKTLKACDDKFLSRLRVFNEESATPDSIQTVCEQFILKLYGAKPGINLNEHRFYSYQRAIARQPLKANFELATLPPTCQSAALHSLRVYLQVQLWRGAILDPTKWGWKLQGSLYRTIASATLPAPEKLLQLVSCSCKGGCGVRCACRKAGLFCTPMCRNCAGHGCTNRDVEPILSEDEDDPVEFIAPVPTAEQENLLDATEQNPFVSSEPRGWAVGAAGTREDSPVETPTTPSMTSGHSEVSTGSTGGRPKRSRVLKRK